ncbi:GntR family transcriptional regulator [Cellulophaga baltica]|uniref:GntR family transcriptional regulator n=1 Tax=Cellulophaga TaxID=104264 RepID=UPI00051CF1A9|nr:MULTISPECIES: GntR family transcriptional regulator [Cellulophaga]KGK31393.1 GntR family transcriptional regulator [Cellulophaga sp. E6(2014)]MCR1026789.1 GntR family transcriptional regulator [Cellulophaga baltica]
MTLVDKIKNLQEVNLLSKHEQIVHGVIDAIQSGILKIGDQLPSINVMVSELGFARKTIVKAYEELKERGLIESKKLKGYFVISEETKVVLRVALILFSFQRFQEEFYNVFRKELGKKYQIDVFFHHNNSTIFSSIFQNIKGKYGMYVVAPIPDLSLRPLIELIPPEKLLIIDRYIKLDKSYSFISQEFEESTYSKLIELLPKIVKYKKFVLFFKNDADYPIGILNAFSRFCIDYNIPCSVLEKYKSGSIKKGNLYFFVSDTYLWDVLKDIRNSEFKVGKEIGILSHNDHVVKEIIFGGITTISTDFKEMAKQAANHIKLQKTTQLIMPSNLIKRSSL